jgi:uncharacterized protein YceK
VRNLLLAAVAMSAGGCMTMENFNQGFAKQTPDWHGGVPQYYGGVRMYLNPRQGAYTDVPWDEVLRDVLFNVAIMTIDVPLTVFADTVTLPWVYAAQREEAARRSAPVNGPRSSSTMAATKPDQSR